MTDRIVRVKIAAEPESPDSCLACNGVGYLGLWENGYDVGVEHCTACDGTGLTSRSGRSDG
jgi:hypothetical protein